jgi:hypothetical protein
MIYCIGNRYRRVAVLNRKVSTNYGVTRWKMYHFW